MIGLGGFRCIESAPNHDKPSPDEPRLSTTIILSRSHAWSPVFDHPRVRFSPDPPTRKQPRIGRECPGLPQDGPRIIFNCWYYKGFGSPDNPLGSCAPLVPQTPDYRGVRLLGPSVERLAYHRGIPQGTPRGFPQGTLGAPQVDPPGYPKE